ncbi:acyltransferase family protein [Methylobrevis pamukkalensis]|uniref:Acyltransferase family protein n=1 Tax=Methylobrevis pamukkalensis TaxID=1439726 RepID=A0A1E3H4Z6_9HYPH|nr:acyltransferase family protein [Methylobrevis pamukkalensis]ODN71382.1 Acyltransferase family protein [Methylobrevis pamukkalensis]
MTIEDVRFNPRDYVSAEPMETTVVPAAVPAAFDRPFSAPLHGVRGVAALAVVWSHVLALLAVASPTLLPLGFMSGGGAAVALFYVLSGAVLAISLKRFAPSIPAFAAYGVRRLFRLYPLLIATTAFGFGYAS